MKRSDGFSAVEVVIGVVVLGIIGGLGYAFVHSMNKASVADQTPQTAEVKTINSEKDVTAATKELDSMDIDDSDTDVDSIRTLNEQL